MTQKPMSSVSNRLDFFLGKKFFGNKTIYQPPKPIFKTLISTKHRRIIINTLANKNTVRFGYINILLN